MTSAATMTPSHQTVSPASRRRSHRKTVSFERTAKIHLIPCEEALWQSGEVADHPTAYEVDNATMLTKLSLNTATAEENYDKHLDKFLASEARARKPRARDSIAFRAQSPRNPAVTPRVITVAPSTPPNQSVYPNVFKAVTRKPVPSRTVTAPYVTKFGEDFSASFRPELTRSTTATSNFADFLPAHKVTTWDKVEKNEAETRRSRTVSGLTSRGLKVAKTAMGRVKAGKKQAV